LLASTSGDPVGNVYVIVAALPVMPQ
jgi:hypothetical protein